MSETPTAAANHENNDNLDLQQRVAALSKAANLAIFATVIASFISLGVRPLIDWHIESANTRATLRVARLLLPFVCLIATAIVTARCIATAKTKRSAATPDVRTFYSAFQRSKLFSLSSLTFAGLFAATGLLARDLRTIDFISPALSLLFLFIGRPTWYGFTGFVQMVTDPVEDEAPLRDAADEEEEADR